MAPKSGQGQDRTAQLDDRVHERIKNHLEVSLGRRRHDPRRIRRLHDVLENLRRIFHRENKVMVRTGIAAWLAICLALGSWIAWMKLDNKPPYAWEGSPASYMTPDPSVQGGYVTANWRLTEVNRLCPAKLQRFFADHKTGAIVAVLDTTEASRSVKLNDEHLPRSFRLPPGLPAVTDYSTLVCFECNIYQRLITPLCVMTPKITFRVYQ